jgi:putative hydrolase of the HAD superfamily
MQGFSLQLKYRRLSYGRSPQRGSRLHVTMQYVTHGGTQQTGSKGPDAWTDIDTVLLDMDGTLLDLRFDNYFWLEVIPERFAQRHSLSLADANQALAPRFAAKQGTLDWYCTDFWSRELELDVAALKHECRAQVRFLPGAEAFLRALQASVLRPILVTNAHHDALRIKAQQTGLLQYFGTAVSSHRYGVPKEHPEFWLKLQVDIDFDPARTLFIDDSLAVLRAARQHGIHHVIAIAHPDTTLARREIAEFPSVGAIVELLEYAVLPKRTL